MINLIHGDSSKYDSTKNDIVVLDPPFNEWEGVRRFKYRTLIAFTNFQNREYITDFYGTPKVELIWHFKDGRWVSNNFPRLCHENILIYGELGNSFVGEKNTNLTPVKKGKGCIGSDKNLGDRIYIPKKRKMLSSVLSYPRNMRNKLGCWGKPEALMTNLIEWLCSKEDSVYDPFMGSGTTGVVCKKLGINFTGIEIKENVFNIAKRRIG